MVQPILKKSDCFHPSIYHSDILSIKNILTYSSLQNLKAPPFLQPSFYSSEKKMYYLTHRNAHVPVNLILFPVEFRE